MPPPVGPTASFFTDEEVEDIGRRAEIKQEDMYKLVMNFLVKNGLMSCANKFFEDTATEPGSNFRRITDHLSVVKAILLFNIEEAFDFVETFHSEVLKQYGPLFINLGQLHYIELMCNGNEDAASQFYQKHISPLVNTEESIFFNMVNYGGIDGPIGLTAKGEELAKSIINGLKPLIAYTVFDDLSEIQGSLVPSMLKMLKRI